MTKKYNTPITYKSASAYADQIKAPAVDFEKRTVSGYLAAFNNRDLSGDILMKGCFAKSLQEHGVASASHRKIAYLWQHDLSEPIGRFTKLEEDDYGLYFEAIVDDTERGNQALKQYASGTLNQHSIGFSYVSDKMRYVEEDDAWVVAEVVLYEGSVVTIGANENTPFTGSKTIDQQTDDLVKRTDIMLKSFDSTIALSLKQLIHSWHALGLANSQHDATVEEEEPADDEINISEIKKMLNEKLKTK